MNWSTPTVHGQRISALPERPPKVNINIGSVNINADSTVGGGFGGYISFDAGEDFLGGVVPGGSIDINAASLLMRGSAAERIGGDGGELDLLSSGRIHIFGSGMVIRSWLRNTTAPSARRIGWERLAAVYWVSGPRSWARRSS